MIIPELYNLPSFVGPEPSLNSFMREKPSTVKGAPSMYISQVDGKSNSAGSLGGLSKYAKSCGKPHIADSTAGACPG